MPMPLPAIDEELVRLYVDEELSTDELSAIFNISKSTLRCGLPKS